MSSISNAPRASRRRSTPDATALRRTVRDIRQDRDPLAARANEIVGYTSAPERRSALALALHFYYSGFESFLERTIRYLDAYCVDFDWDKLTAKESGCTSR